MVMTTHVSATPSSKPSDCLEDLEYDKYLEETLKWTMNCVFDLFQVPRIKEADLIGTGGSGVAAEVSETNRELARLQPYLRSFSEEWAKELVRIEGPR